jgi:hypothetical protein
MVTSEKKKYKMPSNFQRAATPTGAILRKYEAYQDYLGFWIFFEILHKKK